MKSDVDGSISLTVTLAPLYPVADAVNVAVPSAPPLFADVTVTVCLAVPENVSVAGLAVRSLLPLRAIVTVTGELGAVASETSNVAVWPCFTETVAGEARIAGPDSTLTVAGAEVVVAPRLSVARAVMTWSPAVADVQVPVNGELVSVAISVSPA
ncbi:hypothetical protein JNUCC0626_03815 [Lentzea sp. JNUCC 0626]|uniref:hypothetical protein n=1 Tax=Lentzea sp. JNUCC 0626 TaxID=3367513 RepID=UPI003749271A